MENFDATEGYKQVLRAIIALDNMHDAIRMATDGHGLGIPTDWRLYCSKMRRWLYDERDMLEQSLGLKQDGA